MFLFESLYFNVAVVVALVIVIVHRYLTINYDYWKDRGIKYVPATILFGVFKDSFFGKRSLGLIKREIYNDFYNEPFVGIFQLKRPELMIRDPDLIKNILVKDFNHFVDRFNFHNEKTEKLTSNLFMVRGMRWKLMRQKFTPIFTSGKLKNMFHLIIERSEEFKRLLVENVNQDEEQEVKGLLAKFTIDVIGSCGFGVVMNSMSDSDAPFRKMGLRIFETGFAKNLKTFLRLFSPSLFSLLRLRVHGIGVEKFFISTVSEIVENRRNSQIKRHDFIDLLLELKAKGALESETERFEFDDTFMAAQAFIFFAAGFETSSTLMSFVLYELALHPEIQDKTIEEIKRVIAKHDGKLTYDGIVEMQYLDMVVSETLRKYPALANLQRVCVSPYTIPGTKIVIEKGIDVSIPVFAIHYDPQYYPEPHKFIPERFTPEAKQNRHPMVYLPFGEGPRNCIGLRFGKMQSMAGIVSFLQMYKVERCSKTEDRITINPQSVVTTSKDGVWLKMVARKQTI